MRLVAQFIALVLAIGLATPVAAEPETRVDLAYEIYLGGFHVGTLRLRAEIAEQRYHLVADTRSRGVIDLLIGFTSKAETVGRLVDGRVSPNWHAANNTWLGQPRRVRNDYGPDGGVRNSAVPQAKNDDRDPVPPDRMVGALDPLSGGLRAVRAAADGHCRGQVPVFDGRRRYDLAIAAGGPDRVDGPFYAGPALRCSVTLQRIVGFSKDPWLPRSDLAAVMQIWLAELAPDLPPIPVRMQAQIGFAEVLIHLVGLKRD